MNFLTILPILEALNRTVISTKTGADTVAYTGNINKVTINTTHQYTNVYQLFLTHDGEDITLHINHNKRNHTTDYKINDITNIVIT